MYDDLEIFFKNNENEIKMEPEIERIILSKEFYEFYINNINTSIFQEVNSSDILQFPFFSEYFCDYLISRAEMKNIWSGGILQPGKYDERIKNVENFPTQDIHLKDLNLHNFWNYVVNNYFKKIMSYLYKYRVKDYNIAFIVKYDADNNGQVDLEAHHDSSVYTINVALNSSTDYEGGGIRFIRKNITVFNKNKGWALLHPGRVTHYHEALKITKGKRYVLISFNN